MTAEPLTLLTVHAHPDDEASKGAPTLAKYHAEGVHTVLVCCTGGEEGDLQNPTLRAEGQPFHGLTPEQEKAKVVAMRPIELAESARIIGFDEVVMLGYRDSGMADTPPNEHPDSFHMADLDEATGRLVAEIRRTRAQVILTYGDDQRGYPHPDHLRVHDISVLAFDRAGDPDWYPDLGEPFQPSKMYYSTWSRARMLAVHERLLARDGKSPFEEKWFERPDQDGRVTTRLDVSEFQFARSDVAAGPRHPGRSHRGVVVRPRRRRAQRDLPVGGLDPRPLRRRPDPRRPDRGRPLRRGPRPRRQRAQRMTSVQYRVVVGKKDERVDGPDDAELVVTAPLDVVTAADFDAAGGVHARPAQVDRADRPAVRPAALRRGGDAPQLARCTSLSSL